MINIIIFNKIIKQIIEPIKSLQEALISSSIKDSKIFEYEYDDFINELFLTCKEYLNGQIDNKEKGIKLLNSISKEKSDKEENKYTKNLRINNYMMNKLINEQEILMDFSKYIEINENNNFQIDGDKNNSSSLLNDKKMNICYDNNNLSNIMQNKNTFKYQKEEKVKENREFLKNYFKYLNIYIYF